MRKVRFKTFPYALIYWIGNNTLHTVAIMHLHREPGYWRKRMSGFQGEKPLPFSRPEA